MQTAKKKRNSLSDMVESVFNRDLKGTISSMNEDHGFTLKQTDDDPTIPRFESGQGGNTSLDSLSNICLIETGEKSLEGIKGDTRGTNVGDKIAGSFFGEKQEAETLSLDTEAIGGAEENTGEVSGRSGQGQTQIKKETKHKPPSESFSRSIADQASKQVIAQMESVSAQPDSKINTDDLFWLPLTCRQGRVLFQLIINKGVVNTTHLAEYMNMPYGSLRGVIAALKKDRYIVNSNTFHLHKLRGVRYQMDKRKCSAYFDTLSGKPEWEGKREILLSRSDDREMGWTNEAMQSNQDLNLEIENLVGKKK